MPLYEYQCRECNQSFEKLERVSAESTRDCPSCGGTATRKLSAPALQFKGSGWYVTDYGKGNGKNPEAAAKPAEASSDSGSKDKPGSSSKESSSGSSEAKSTSSSKSSEKVA